MKVGTLTLVLLAGLTPIIVFGLLAVVPTLDLVRWEPPVLWTKQFGVPGSYGIGEGNAVTSLATFSDGFFATGYVGISPSNIDPSTDYLFLNRYGLDGTLVSSSHLPAMTNGYANTIDSVSTGNESVFIAGKMNDTGFVQRDDLNGNSLWARQFDGIDPKSVSVGSNRVFLSSHNEIFAFDLSGNSLWSKSLVNVTNLSVYADSKGLYTAGYQFTSNFPPNTQAFTSKYDSDGNLVWTQRFDSPTFTCYCTPTGIGGDASGIYVSGSTSNPFPGHSLALAGRSDMFLRKYDLNGNVLWTAESGAPDLSAAGTTLVCTENSGVYVLVLSAYEWVLKYDANGNYNWHSAGLPGGGVLHASISARNGVVYVGGATLDHEAIIYGLAESSSLILFGIDPPLSFLVAALISGGVILSVFLFKRKLRWRTDTRPTTDQARKKAGFQTRKPT